MKNNIMRIKTRNLVAGNVMGSGELVLQVKITKTWRTGPEEVWVSLKHPKTGYVRVATWSIRGTVTIKE